MKAKPPLNKSVTYLVSIFKFSVVGAFVLHGVIRQVNHPVLNVLSSVLSAARPQIPVLIEITLQIAVYSLSDRVASDVEFSVFVQQWSFAVLLNDVRPFLTVDVRVAYDLFDLT